MDLGLKGKVALVTGGASGIGRAIAAALLDEGCIVRVADFDLSAAKGIKQFASPQARLVGLDVSDSQAVQRAADAIVSEHGRIDILINSAGILMTKPLAESTFEDWDRISKVNLAGVFYCSRAVLPAMVAQGYGKIVNIASVSSVKGGGALGNVLYGTTKAGVVALTQGFARELGPSNINVNAISPGVVEGTRMITETMTPEVRERVSGSFPMRRFPRMADVAALAAYLASDVSQSITGQVVVIDCGFLVR